MLANHPDSSFSATLLEFIDFGAPLMYNGPTLNQVYPNLKLCDLLKTEVQKSMIYDISKGWKVGLFAEQPFLNFVGSPMGAFLKPSINQTVKTRV